MRACIWHADIHLTCRHVFGVLSFIFACGHVFVMRASIRHVGYTLRAHMYYFECMNFACKHVVFGWLILGMCMCLICGHLFDMCTSI